MATPPSTAAQQPDPYLHQTLDATITHVERDFVDLCWQLPGASNAIGRLYQSDSRANGADEPLLKKISRYAKGQVLRVYVTQAGDAKNHFRYRVHERWVDAANPWLDLNLYEDDVVSGAVIRAVGRTDQAGWLVQLDESAPFPEAQDAGLQPDIIVFLPLTELPWADGSTSERPVSGSPMQRLKLLRGDKVLLCVYRINTPPEHPKASILRLINQRDAASFGSTLPPPIVGSAARNVPALVIKPDHMSHHALLEKRVIWLVDDDEQQMNLLAHRLQSNGASVKTFLPPPGNWDAVCNTMIAELNDSLFSTKFTNKGIPNVILMDNQLHHHSNGGTQLIQRWHEQAATQGTTLPNCILISTWLPKLSAVQKASLFSALQRPLHMGALLQTLAGKPVWELRETQETPDLDFALVQPTSRSPAQWLQRFMHDAQAEFAVLLGTQGNAELSLLAHVGTAPFHAQQLSQVMELSDLRLLVSGQLQELVLHPAEMGNTLLKTPLAGHALWTALRAPQSGTTKPDWVLGIGWKTNVPINERRWMQRCAAETLSRMRQEAGMNNLADLLGKGMRLDSMAHEWQRRQNRFNELVLTLAELRDMLGHDAQAPADVATVLDESLPDLRTAATELQQTANMLLGLQRGRHTVLDLPLLMTMLKPMAEASCREREVQLIWPEQIPPLVLSLPSTAVSVPLLNLIDNAAKHHVRHENNHVIVAIAVPATGGKVENLLITVSDNSFGLNAAQRANLFEPFASTAKLDERHGLGLWLSQQVVSRLGGSITLAWSWRGIGTCFELSLPLALEGDLESET